MKSYLFLLFSLIGTLAFAQPNDCNEAVSGCSTPSFGILPPNSTTNVVDFTANSVTNPSTNPQGVNSGCLLSGETSSTFITINVVSSGTLEWSMIGLTAGGTPSGSGCFDWIMWPNVNNNGCAGINGNTLPPVACNWNGTCNGNTGMSNPANYPPAASSSSYQPPINVTAGQSYILCLSNYSGTSQNVNLNFFGSAAVVCGVSAADQTICLGNSAQVTVSTPGYVNPTFNWLVTNGVSNTSSGTNVTVTPTVTTTYSVVVTQVSPPLQDTATFTITVVNPPAPNAGPDQTVCLGQPIYLTGTLGSATNTASWQTIYPTGLTPPASATFTPNFNSLTPTVTVNQPGTYQFILRESNATCGLIRDTMFVTVVDLQIAASSVAPSCGGYADGSITITSAGANEFSFDNGTTWVASNTQSGFAAGTYNVCAKNALGCQKCTTVTLIDPTPVMLTVSNDTTVCENGSASLVATATGGTSYLFHWNGITSTAGNQLVSPLTTGYYAVQAENQAGCLSQMDSILVTVRPGLSAVMSAAGNACPGYPASISVTPSGGIGAPYTMTWNTSQTDIGAMSTLTDSPNSTTTYTVTITDACESTPITLTNQIITYTLPVPQMIVDEPIKCEPAVFQLTNTSSLSAGTVWNFSNGEQFINMDNVSPSELYAGTYDVQLIVMSPDGCIDSAWFNGFLTVQQKPIADFKWSPDPVTMFNTEVLFTQYSQFADTYIWDFGIGIPGSSTQESQFVLYPDGQTGHYEVTLIATSYLGCSDTITKTVAVLPEVIIYAPNAFTPDGDEFNQTWKVYMEGVDLFDFELLIFNRWGELIWESHDIEQGWDGTYHNKIAQQGQYTWIIRTKDALNDKKYEYRGSVNIIR